MLAVSLEARAAPKVPEKQCDPNDADVCSAPVAAGQPAPFSGQLLTQKLAIQLGQKAENFTERLKIEVDYIRRVYQLDVDLEKQLRTIESDTWGAQKKAMEEALNKALQPLPFYERPAFIATVASLITLTVAGIVLFVAVRVIEVTHISTAITGR